MIKKRIAIGAMAACFALTATFTGCSLVSKNSKADMEQVIATIDIRKGDKFEESNLFAYKDAINPTSIIKRDLVSYFLNVGYSYVQNNGNSYKDTFNMLMDALVNNAILTQYATLELLKDKSTNTQSDLVYDANALTEYNKLSTEKEKYEYLLGGESSVQVQLAKYKLYSSLNSAIDSYEHTILKEESEFKGEGTRTTPTNLNTEQDNYYPVKADKKSLDYGVYTGYEGYLLSDSGAYKDDALEGTTLSTRVKAYNIFINNLRGNNLIDADEAGNLNKVLDLKYIQSEYISQLESRIVNKYYDDIYHVQQEEELKKDNYKYLNKVYNDLLEDQTDNYSTASAFETAMGSMSATSFILYNPSTADSAIKGTEDNNGDPKKGKFGFVYNILLPFSARQSVKLSELTSIKNANDDNDYYYRERNKLLREIKTEDQRSVWFNGADNYSFKVSENYPEYEYFGKGDRDYLFFEGNLLNSEEGGRYEKLLAYDGRYSYNGKVCENTDGSYTVIGEELTIDGMLREFSEYINFVLGGDKVKFDGYNPNTTLENTAYYEVDKFEKDKKDIDYSKFVYASGRVEFENGSDFNDKDLFNVKSDRYKAMSAVNELQFAYTTDTGVLSQYVGYNVSAYDTNYIKEFEYAAKLAVSQGSGAFNVCAGDYGWHLIYVTYAFDFDENGNNGNVYTPDWAANIEEKGTFENLFFEWIKTTNLSDVTKTRRDKIINDYSKEDVTVVKYENRYQNLLDLDNN
ncbi:MAG: hypothetical protein K2L12_01460 [Clostridia bacterium]|nr:hypothetical protein [Clostridia bacterium]